MNLNQQYRPQYVKNRNYSMAVDDGHKTYRRERRRMKMVNSTAKKRDDQNNQSSPSIFLMMLIASLKMPVLNCLPIILRPSRGYLNPVLT